MSLKLLAPITNLNVFFLNLAFSRSFAKYQSQILAYMRELCEFSQWYCKTRYGLDIHTEPYYPYFVPKTYEDVQKYDATQWRLSYFGQQLQMYCGYGLHLNPHGIGTDGYCECLNGPSYGWSGSVKPDGTLYLQDMMYADMQEYVPGGFFGNDIYGIYSYFSRVFFHELDHQILNLAGSPIWSTAVHKAAVMPLEIYVKVGEGRYFLTSSPAPVNVVKFQVQQNPLLV